MASPIFRKGAAVLAALLLFVPGASAQTATPTPLPAGADFPRLVVGDPTGPTPVAGGINAQAVTVNGTPVVYVSATPRPTDTPQPTATPRATDTPIPAPTAYPTAAANILLEGTGARGIQAGVAGLTANTPVAGSYPYCSAGGAGCVMAWATPIPATASCTGYPCGTPATFITNSLGSDVALNNVANYIDGPSAAQGSTGTWCGTGTVTALDTAGVAAFLAKLWDGTTVIASTQQISTGANNAVTITLGGCLASPASNLRISVRDSTSTSGAIKFNSTGLSKDSTLTVWRYA